MFATRDITPDTVNVRGPPMEETEPAKLRELAAWYREYAKRAGDLNIWDARLRTADELEAKAARIERERRRTGAG